MKAAILILATTLCLAGCHAGRDKAASSTAPAAGSSAATSSTGKAIEKSRDAMMGKSMDVQSEHWASTPAASTTASAPTATSDASVPANSSSPAAAPAVPKGGKH